MTIPTAEMPTGRPGLRDIEQILCPFERVRAINTIVRADCTLPGRLARVRTAALREARRQTKSVAELAERVGMRRSRVSTLLNSTVLDMQPAAGR
jgi:hypothetical protein